MTKKLKEFQSEAELAKNKKFVHDVYARGQRGFNRGVNFIAQTEKAAEQGFMMLNLIATAKDDHVYLNELTVVGDGRDHKKGFGGEFMKWLVSEADRKKVELRLTAEPLPVRKLTPRGTVDVKGGMIPLSKLIGFYKRFGFVSDKGHRERMTRKPK